MPLHITSAVCTVHLCRLSLMQHRHCLGLSDFLWWKVHPTHWPPLALSCVLHIAAHCCAPAYVPGNATSWHGLIMSPPPMSVFFSTTPFERLLQGVDGGDGGDGDGDGDGDGGGGGDGGEGMYEIVLGPRVAPPSETSDSAGWPPSLPTYPCRYNEPEQAPVTTPPDARQKFQPPSPCRITINPSVRTQQPDEAS